ncbi:Uncharacterised protein [Mycobacteroides abscessus subsp. abscessus]|nr:Uncharacterised protein [Mycobacteroides abscessus subsp. abscessus]
MATARACSPAASIWCCCQTFQPKMPENTSAPTRIAATAPKAA